MSVHQMVTFYIPLSRPIRVPAEDGVWLERKEPLEWLHQYFPHSEWKLPKELYESRENFVLLRVAQIFSKSVSIDMSYMDDAFELAAREAGHEPSPSHGLSTSQVPLDTGPEPVVVNSILVVSTPILRYDAAPFNELVSWAFDRCLQSARRYETAYAVESADLLYTPLTRVTCPPQVPYVLYDFGNSNSKTLGVFMVHIGMSHFTGFGPPLNPMRLERMRVRFGRLNRADPWHIFVTLSRDANRSLEIEGNFASAVIQAFSSGESMLDTLLQSLAWESLNFDPNTQLSRDTIISWFSLRSSLRSRMNRVFPTILKRWNMGNQLGACYAWVNRAAPLRNRIVHGGYEPHEDQAREVVDLLRTLEHEVKDILLHDHNRGRYPRTVFLWIGRQGLIERSMYSGKLKRLDEASTDRDWIGDFISFRQSLDQQLWSKHTPVG